MKPLFNLLFFCLVHSWCLSQIDSLFLDTVQEHETSTIVLHTDFANLLCNQNRIYVYNESRDTLFLSNLDVGQFCYCDSLQVIDTIQINGTGSKEIVFYRKCSGETNEHGGTFDIVEKTRIHKYEIWDLDVKEMLFEAVCDYKLDYNRFSAYQDPSHQQGSKKFRCDFSIDKEGEIKIKNIQRKNWELTTIKEGTYIFIDGKYVVIE